MSSTAEVFAAMGEAVAGSGGKALQRKFKVCDGTKSQYCVNLDLHLLAFALDTTYNILTFIYWVSAFVTG